MSATPSADHPEPSAAPETPPLALAPDRPLPLPAPRPGTVSVDVRFDGRRVWSVDVRDREAVEGSLLVEWPEALVPHLVGRTRLSAVDSADGSALLDVEAVFESADAAGAGANAAGAAAGTGASTGTGAAGAGAEISERRVRVEDARGRPLMVNKWGRLGVALDGMGEDVQRRILEQASVLAARLEEFGLPPFVVGGTLLGGVRDGALLPHDDDADLAYLSAHTKPADVALEAFRLAHRLEALGYEIVRHSAAHLQLVFRDDAGASQYYIDIFSAFFTDDGRINQPFHVRGEMRRDQMLPFGSVTIDGFEFATPADTDRWLTINYDENWRTPIPGFRLDTPLGTRRRFDNWFGGFNAHREFWDARYAAGTDDAADEPGAARSGESDADAEWAGDAGWLATRALASPVVFDLGCGSGLLSNRLAARGGSRRIIAGDFSSAARAAAERSAVSNDIETAHLNVYRLASLGLPRRLGVAGPFDAVANHLLEQIGRHGRENALRFMRMALRSGGAAFATCNGAPATPIVDEDPTTWHLDRFALASEAAALGMGVEFFDLEASGANAHRRPFGARFALADAPDPRKERTMKQRLKQLVLGSTRGAMRTELYTLRARVAELETELDEVRRDNLRVAELIDLAERALVAGAVPGDAAGSGSAAGPGAGASTGPDDSAGSSGAE